MVGDTKADRTIDESWVSQTELGDDDRDVLIAAVNELLGGKSVPEAAIHQRLGGAKGDVTSSLQRLQAHGCLSVDEFGAVTRARFDDQAIASRAADRVRRGPHPVQR
jgi:hypothetical protein